MSNQRKAYADYKKGGRAYEPIGPGQSGGFKPPGTPKKGCAPVIIIVLAVVFLMFGGLAAYIFQVQQPQGVEETASPAPAPAPAPTLEQTAQADSTPPPLGHLDNASLIKVIRSNMAQVRACNENELKASPALAGQVRVRFLIAESGAVDSCAVTKTTLHNKAVEDCICDRIVRWRFPPPDDGVFSASYTFTFSSAGM